MCYLWGRDLYGPAAGRLASVLWCFSPTILGQAQMITPDTGATSLGLAAASAFWHWLRRPNFAGAGLAGIVLGLALLTKGTWIILFGLWPALWLMWRVNAGHQCRNGAAGAPRELLQGVWMFVFALYVLNLAYGFERPFERLGGLKFISRSLSGEAQTPASGDNRFANTWLGQMPLPVPANYVLGINVQKRDFENGYRSYLRGEWKHGGWWYYYAYAWLIKEPLATWCLTLLAVVTGLRRWIGSGPRAPTGTAAPVVRVEGESEAPCVSPLAPALREEGQGEGASSSSIDNTPESNSGDADHQPSTINRPSATNSSSTSPPP